MRTRDVVVVGGGPAGSATALLLAREGWDVEVLERREFPRAKPCGDCISPGANVILQRMGVWNAVLAARPALLEGWRLSAAPDSAFASMFDSSTTDPSFRVGLAIERRKLDLIMLDSARAAGASISTGVRAVDLARNTAGSSVAGVIVERGGRRELVRARLVVGADGLRSLVARKLEAHRRVPRLRKFSLTAHVRGVPAAGALGEMHVHGDACLGIAPVENGPAPLYNVTVVARALSPGGSTGPQQTLRRLLRHFSRDDLAALIGDDTVVLASGPFDWPVRRIVTDGAVLTGDASGYYDPFTGQGIYQALAGAELLAGHAASALRAGNVTARSLVGYATEHALAKRRAHRLQRCVEYVCARPRLARMTFEALRRSPDAADQLIRMTADIPGSDLRSPLLLARLLAAMPLRAIA